MNITSNHVFALSVAVIAIIMVLQYLRDRKKTAAGEQKGSEKDIGFISVEPNTNPEFIRRMLETDEKIKQYVAQPASADVRQNVPEGIPPIRFINSWIFTNPLGKFRLSDPLIAGHSIEYLQEQSARLSIQHTATIADRRVSMIKVIENLHMMDLVFAYKSIIITPELLKAIIDAAIAMKKTEKQHEDEKNLSEDIRDSLLARKQQREETAAQQLASQQQLEKLHTPSA